MELRVEDVSVERGGRLVLSHVSFRAQAGELVRLAGPNGAGKTTLLRTIAGLIEPASGAIRLDGGEGDAAIGERCHFAGHLDALKPALTVTENLSFWQAFLGGGDVERGLAAFGLSSLRSFPAAVLSAGQRRRLSLSRLRLGERPLWLLDEPASHLDQASADALVGVMQGHLDGGGIIVAASHGALGLPARHEVDLGQAA